VSAEPRGAERDQADVVAALVAAFPDLRLLTLVEAAGLTRIPREELKELCRRGEIAARRHGTDYRIPPAALRRYLEAFVAGRAAEGATPIRPDGARRRLG